MCHFYCFHSSFEYSTATCVLKISDHRPHQDFQLSCSSRIPDTSGLKVQFCKLQLLYTNMGTRFRMTRSRWLSIASGVAFLDFFLFCLVLKRKRPHSGSCAGFSTRMLFFVKLGTSVYARFTDVPLDSFHFSAINFTPDISVLKKCGCV